MPSKRYTILVADRSTGVTRRFTVSLRTLLVAAGATFTVCAVPVLVGLGARWSAAFDLAHLQASNQALRLENESYRAVTGELTTQITSLQGVVTELGLSGATDPAQQKAIANLPAMIRNRAMGGSTAPQQSPPALVSATFGSPDDTFGVLRDLLGTIESRLRIVRTDVQRWQALAGATPSMWPVAGWLSDGFGRRRDPFTGEAAQHLGLDISADKGQPIFATANGTVVSAGYHSNYGNLLVVGHEFGLTTRYAHLSRFAVKPGAKVERGDIIGYVGSTGRSTAPHLHYEVWANGRALNPLRLLTSPPSR